MRPSYTGTLKTHDGLTLFTQRWEPEGAPKAAVALVHGYAEHSDRYAHVAAFLTERGYAVHSYDQRGYGRSEGRRAYVDTFDQYVVDLHSFMQAVRERAPGQPVFLLGHSMGGAVCATYCVDHGARPKGLALSSAALKVSADLAPLLQRSAQLAGRLAPTLPTIRLPRGLISRDAAVVARAEADPLCYHGRLPARTGAELLRASRHLYENLERLTLPLLLFHGTADGLTDPDGSRATYRRARSADKSLKLYDGLLHETLNEPEQGQVLADLAAWFDARA